MPRRAALWPALGALALCVLAVHVWLMQRLAQEIDSFGFGASPARVQRFEVAFVRELAPSAPPAPPAPAVAAPKPARRPPGATAWAAMEPLPRPPEAAASAAASSEAPAPAVEPVELATLPTLDAVASAGLLAAPAEPTPPSFDWPPSTRLSYRLTGWYRGPVEGQAQVEWLRRGDEYQVHLVVTVGPSFAPLITRRMSSQGRITEQGLAPRDYEEHTRVALAAPRHLRMRFEGGQATLANGQTVPGLPQLQDTASQFVQMTWRFITDPRRLQAGHVVEMPLALPRRVDLWLYDVLGEETLDTPVGPVLTLHVKPRRALDPRGDLVPELWVAPSLQYLPVRFVIRQDAETYADLLIERLPQQAAAETTPREPATREPATREPIAR